MSESYVTVTHHKNHSQNVLIIEIWKDSHLMNSSSSYHVIALVVQEGLKSGLQSFPAIQNSSRKGSLWLLLSLTLAFSSLMRQLRTILRGMNANSAQSLIQGLFVLFPRSLKKYGWEQIMWSLQTGEVSKILSTTETLTSLVCKYFHLQSLWRAGIFFNFFFS